MLGSGLFVCPLAKPCQLWFVYSSAMFLEWYWYILSTDRMGCFVKRSINSNSKRWIIKALLMINVLCSRYRFAFRFCNICITGALPIHCFLLLPSRAQVSCFGFNKQRIEHSRRNKNTQHRTNLISGMARAAKQSRACSHKKGQTYNNQLNRLYLNMNKSRLQLDRSICFGKTIVWKENTVCA